MALATQCPYCQTIFRVAHDQLKLRAGLVRCGACKEIFNGIENLLRSEDGPVAPVPTVTAAENTTESARSSATTTATAVPGTDEVRWPELPPTSGTSTETESAEANPADDFPAIFFDPSLASSATGAALEAESGERVEPLQSGKIVPPPTSHETLDPLDRMTLIHISDDIDYVDTDGDPTAEAAPNVLHPDQAGESTPLDTELLADAVAVPDVVGSSGSLVARSTHESADELDQAIDYLQRKPWRGSKKALSREDVEGRLAFDNDDDDYHADEPGFVARSRSAQHRRSTIRKLQYSAVVLLAICAVAQSVYLLRDQLAVRLPASRSALESACHLVGCRVTLPAQIDSVSIESNELAALPSSKNTYSLNLLLRNHSSVPQRWPAIELTLLDSSDQPLVRRVFNPPDYLPASMNESTGFAQNTEQPARIRFEASQQKAANYRAYLFYP